MSESRQVAIVVADDHIGVAHALTSLLGRFYATLPAANSIPQLRSLLQEWTGSSQASGAQLVVLLDLEFPGGEDGLEALPDLRRGFPGVRFVVHSAREQQTIVRTAMLEGADGYVAKACGIAELRQAIASAVAGRPKVLLGSGVEPTLGGGATSRAPLDACPPPGPGLPSGREAPPGDRRCAGYFAVRGRSGRDSIATSVWGATGRGDRLGDVSGKVSVRPPEPREYSYGLSQDLRWRGCLACVDAILASEPTFPRACESPDGVHPRVMADLAETCRLEPRLGTVPE